MNTNENARERAIVRTSALGIVINVALAALKICLGILASSIAVISEGVNNATDVATSLITIIGTKLSGRRPTRKHPFGFGRIEYLTSLIIAAVILFSAWELIRESVIRIFKPVDLNVDMIVLAAIAVSGVVKLWLGWHTIRVGRRVASDTLVALGTECRADSLVTLVTIISSLVFLILGKNVDAFAGVVTSIFIFRAGYEALSETVGNLLGRAGNRALANEIYSQVRSTPGVINAVDMKLHNYGPDKYSGSVNIEIDHERNIGEIYQGLHKLQLDIMHKQNVTMVFGLYAVDNSSAESRELRREIAKFVRAHDHVVSFHALYIDEKEKRIYCDLIVDYDLSDWDELRRDFTEYMRSCRPDLALELTIETEFV